MPPDLNGPAASLAINGSLRWAVCLPRAPQSHSRYSAFRRRGDRRLGDVRTADLRIPLLRLRVAYVDLARQASCRRQREYSAASVRNPPSSRITDGPILGLTKRHEKHQGKLSTSESFRPPYGKGAQCESIPTRPLVVRPGKLESPVYNRGAFFYRAPSRVPRSLKRLGPM